MRRLSDVPLFNEEPEPTVTAAEVAHSPLRLVRPTAIDWSLVVVLRRKASEVIAREVEETAAASGVARRAVDAGARDRLRRRA